MKGILARIFRKTVAKEESKEEQQWKELIAKNDELLKKMMENAA